MLKIGVIGCGNRALGAHIPLLKLFSYVEITAICDIRKEQIDKAIKIIGHNVNSYYHDEYDYINMLKNEKLDAVIIATPWEWHTKMAIEAMENGIISGVEVPIAITLDECWQLIGTYEKTKVECMMLENVCYRDDVLAVLNMCRMSLFGDVLYCHAGYQHDLRNDLLTSYSNFWRGKHHKYRNGDLYPTHSFGPLSNILNINHGNRITKLSSYSTKNTGLNRLSFQYKNNYEYYPFYDTTFKTGDIVTTVIETINGQNIVLIHNVTTPRPYSLGFRVQGENGLWMEDGNLIYFEKNPEEILKIKNNSKNKSNYVYYNINDFIKSGTTFYIPHKPFFSIFNDDFTIKITVNCTYIDDMHSFCPIKIGNLFLGEGISQNSFKISLNNNDIVFYHKSLQINTIINRTIQVTKINNMRDISFWLDDIFIGNQIINDDNIFYNNDGIYVGDNIDKKKFNGYLSKIQIFKNDDNHIKQTCFNPFKDNTECCRNLHTWDNTIEYFDIYKHPLYVKYINIYTGGAFHGGMDWYMMNAFLGSIKNKTKLPIDIYDSVTWSAISALSEKSIINGNMPIDFPDFTNGKWMHQLPTFELCEYINKEHIYQLDKYIFYVLIENSLLINKNDLLLYENNKKLIPSENIQNLEPGKFLIKYADNNDIINVIVFNKENQGLSLPLANNILSISFWLYIDFTNIDESIYWYNWRYILDGRTCNNDTYVAIASYNLVFGPNINRIKIDNIEYNTNNINDIYNKWVYIYIEFINPVKNDLNLMSRYSYTENLYGMLSLISLWDKKLSDYDIFNINSFQPNVPGRISFYNLSDFKLTNNINDSNNVSPNGNLIGGPKWRKSVHPSKINKNGFLNLNGKQQHFVLLFSPSSGDPRINGKYYSLY